MVKARKKFLIIAYDIADTNKRTKVATMLESYGTRINLSVFECMLTASQFSKLRFKIEDLIDTETDQVVYYTICLKCYTKVIKYPEKNPEIDIIKVV